jgi:regulation of enolase protein 1 (concanavalin A-like superfamily)
VSVVTNGNSDDANGVDVNVSDIWLQVVRIGNLFAMHYALNGHDWRMVRYLHLALTAEVKIGLVAQCPVGMGATIDWLELGVERRTLGNMRAGI